MVGLAMDLTAEDITSLKWAALLHDIGKLSIPSRVLDKPTLLTEKEYTSMKRHVEYTKAILDRISGFKEISRVASSHHERWDGRGYPQGLSGEDIPRLSRIIAVADTYDAMTSGRAYRAGLSSGDACSELQRYAGVDFDPEVICAAVPILYHLAD
jgi:putative nucleotidyltransferase with HDIG domain